MAYQTRIIAGRTPFFLALVFLSACASDPRVPVPIMSTYDRAWRAALDAARFEGVRIVHEDQASGIIIGTKGQQEIIINMRQLADEKVQMEIKLAGPQGGGADPNLPGRITRGYESRMGL